MSPDDRRSLVRAVQANCDIADARHAADLSLCNYLLQMREYYRWEQGLPFGAVLPRADVGAWLAAREARWEGLAGRAFEVLPPDGGDAMDAQAPVARLAAAGLTYGAGLAASARPSFFLAERLETRPADAEGLVVQVCGRELARGLHAPPALIQGRTVLLRRDALARWLWQLVETQGVKQAAGPMQAVVQAYGWDRGDFDAGLPRALDELGEVLLLHEQGEHRVGLRLGEGWARLRLAQTERRTDLALQAVRDLLADLEHTLPTLLARDARTEVHFWMAGLDGLRLQLCPAIKPAYRAWCASHDPGPWLDLNQRGAAHFGTLAQQALALAPNDGIALRALLAAPEAVFAG